MTTNQRRLRILVSVALGIVTLDAAPALADATATTPNAAGCSSATQRLQRQLDRQHYPVGRIDGCPGPALRAAVQAFQKAKGLAPDGVPGPATRAAVKHRASLRPVLRNKGTHAEVDLDRQLALVVRNGRITRIYSVSTGRKGFATPKGTFRVERKERRSWSTQYHVSMPYASYFTRGVAFHSGSVDTARISHGCIHVPAPFAADLYTLLKTGTTVVVH